MQVLLALPKECVCVCVYVHIYIYIKGLQGKNDSCFTRMLASFGYFTSGPIDLGSSR